MTASNSRCKLVNENIRWIFTFKQYGSRKAEQQFCEETKPWLHEWIRVCVILVTENPLSYTQYTHGTGTGAALAKTWNFV